MMVAKTKYKNYVLGCEIYLVSDKYKRRIKSISFSLFSVEGVRCDNK